MQINNRVIFHCDANNFFASVECALNPNLKGVPLAVTGDEKKRNGIVLAKNYIAKKFKVETGDVVWQAKQKCPGLVCVSPNYKAYSHYSKLLFDIYQQYTDHVEPFGIDECWLDVTSTLKFFGTEQELANIIKEHVKKELGITISVGVSFCKLFSKLASDMKKPDAVTIISRSEFKNKIYPLPLRSIIGIGRKLEKKFNHFGIKSLGEITKLSDDLLKFHFGIIGTDLKQKLLGNDFDAVAKIDKVDEVKSIGNGTTTLYDIKSPTDVKVVVRFLCEEIATRLRAKKLKTSCISVSIRTNLLCWSSKSHSISYKTNTAKDIFDESVKVISSFWDYTQKIRSIRVCCSSLASEDSCFQINFFENTQKKSNLNLAIDQLREKYGYNVIMPCNICSQKIISDTALRV